jgi:hypothetical protein
MQMAMAQPKGLMTVVTTQIHPDPNQPKESMMAVTTQIRRDLAQHKGLMTAVTTPMAMTKTLQVMGKAHESW